MDIYKQPIKLRTPDNKDNYNTLVGAILSVITFIFVFSYGGFKLSSLISR